MTLESDFQKLEPGALVELFVIDLTDLGGGLEYFHAGTNELKQPVVWQGNTYMPFPVKASGFEFKGKGTLPRPVLQIANVTSYITALVLQYEDLVGATVIRKRTMVKYLDAVNFTGGVNPTADPNTHLPDDIYEIDRRSNETDEFVEFELASPLDVRGMMIPKRQIVQNVCPWRYRGAECGYTGGAVAKSDDTPTSDILLDQCGKRLTSCKLRFGQFGELPFGGFPAAGLIKT